MQVKELQHEMTVFVNRWHEKRKTAPNERSSVIHLMEEVGELASQYVNQEKRKDKFDPAEIENAIGDILFQVIDLASIRKLDIETIVTNIIKNEEGRLHES